MMKRVCNLPDYEELVGTMAGERISIAADMVMTHLYMCIRMCHRIAGTPRSSFPPPSPKLLLRGGELCQGHRINYDSD